MKTTKLFKTLLLLLCLVGGVNVSWAAAGDATDIPLTVGNYLTTSTAVGTGTINTDDDGNLGGIYKDATATFTLTNASAQDMVLTFLTANNNSSSPQVTVTLNDGSDDFFTETVDIENTGGWTPITQHVFDVGEVPAGTITLTFAFTNTSSYVCNLGSIGVYNKAAYIASLDEMPGDITLSKGTYSGCRYNYNDNGKVGWLSDGTYAYYPSLYVTAAGKATLNIGMTYNGDGTINVKIVDATTGETEVNKNISITSSDCKGLTTPTSFELDDITAGFKTLKLTMSTSASYLIDYQDLSLSIDSWTPIAIDLRDGQLGTDKDNPCNKYLTIDGSTYTYTDAEPGSYNAYFTSASYNGSQHGYVNLKASVPVKPGYYKITLGTCQFGTGTGYIKNADESSTLSITDATGHTVTSFNQNTGVCYDQNTSENIVSVWYEATTAQTFKVICGNYTPYISIEKVNSVPEEKYVVTFENDTEGASGTVPAKRAITKGKSMTIPTNRTLYKEGYTLTGWDDGTSTYDVGESYTPSGDATLTAVFTENEHDLTDATSDVVITWDFQTQNGCPTVQWQNGTSDFLVTQATVEGSTIDVKLGVNTYPGKFNNASNTDWCQVNNGTTFTFPSSSGSTVQTYSMYEPKDNSSNKSTLDDNGYTSYASYIATYKTTETSGTSTLTIKSPSTGNYYRYLKLTYHGFVAPFTNTWQFGKSNDAPTFALQRDPEYTYTVNSHSLIINTDNGKLNNSGRSDAYAQCNGGTVFKVPSFKGAKLTWGKYYSGDQTGFVIDGQLYSDYYIVPEDGTVEMKAEGIGYIEKIKIEPETMYDITGTISGGTINGADLIFTATGNGESYTTTIADGGFELSLPADTYNLDLSSDVAYVIDTPTSITVEEDGSIGAITIEEASAQTVSGVITNAPAEAFTLTFTGDSHSETVNCAANATSYTTSLYNDTYVISSSVGTLSALSEESFKVTKTAVTHNIYFPETIPAATQAEITVDNTAAVSANHYKSVSDALAAVKAGKISNPVITLTSGQTYREQVVVDMANVTFKTSGSEKATITFYYGIGYGYYSLNSSGYYDKDRAMTRNSKLNVGPARWGCTVLVTKDGNNFKAENIKFENSFNQYYTDEEVTDGVLYNSLGSSITYDRTLRSGDAGYIAADARDVTERAAAIAFENNPTGCQLYNCVFIGSQDTFYSSGKVYVKNCDIQGNTDYIFGGGNIVFDHCNLVIGGYSDKANTAYITANTSSSGECYIFRDCTVTSAGRTYVSANLGRDWGGANSNVYFFNLKNEIGASLSYGWSDMGGGVNAGTANLHIYDFNPTVNANYSTTGKTGANVNGLVSDDDATSIYTGVVTRLSFTPEHVYDIILDENIYYNSLYVTAANGGTGDVTLTRNIKAGKWNTIVLPFDIDESDIETVFGDGTSVAELASGTESTLSFSTTLTNSKMQANQPYAIKVTKDFSTATINSVDIVEDTPTQTVGDWDFVGTYSSDNIPTDSYFFSSNKIYKAADGTNTIKPFRAYFTYTGGASSAREIIFTIDEDDVTTDVSEALRVKSEESAQYYNLAGQRVAQPQKGLYLVNGRKVIIK